MRAAFVILSSDEAPLLEVALAATASEGFDGGLVIDNASSDATASVAARFGVERLALERRVPYTEAMNIGLRAVDADFVACLQADTFVTAGYLEACLAPFADGSVAAVAPKLVRTTGVSEADRLDVLDAAGMTFDRRRKNRLVGHGAPGSAFEVAGEVFGVDGAAAVFRRDALEDCAVEGRVFDENLPGWGCDADLAWRMRLLGWRSWYEPAAVVHHIRRYSPSTRGDARPEDRRTQFRNRLLMIAKNDRLSDLRRDLGPLLWYELMALGYAVLVEHELLGGYVEAWGRLPETLRQRRLVQSRRRVARVPFGMQARP